MKSYIIYIGLIVLLISCSTPKYVVKSESDLKNVNLELNALNYIPLMDVELKESSILDSTYHLLKSKKYARLNKYLLSIETDESDYFLAKTFYHVSKGEYKKAIDFLNMIEGNRYILIKKLLGIDLTYEIMRCNGYCSTDFKKFLKDYQQLFDNYPDKKYLRKIIALRTRSVRYNY